MDRGPLALFGAIVAVGLGPSLWLGVQFGEVEVAPTRPPAVSVQDAGGQELLGGAGAGAAPTADSESLIRTTPKANVRTLGTSSSKRSPSPSPSEPEPSASPSESADPGDDPGTTPTGPTGTPTSPDETDDPTLPPAPPPGGTGPAESPTDPAESGGIGAGEIVDASESRSASAGAGRAAGQSASR